MNKTIDEYNQQRLNKLANYLKELRFAYGSTQEMVCNEINMHRNSLIRIESHKSSGCNIITLMKLADYYNIPLSELFDEKE